MFCKTLIFLLLLVILEFISGSIHADFCYLGMMKHKPKDKRPSNGVIPTGKILGFIL